MTSPVRRTALDGILDNPLVGLAPWIVYAVLEGPSRLELSSGIAFAIAFLVLCLNWLRGQSPKALEFADVVFFAVLMVVVAFANDDTRRWLELWGGEVANIALAVIVLATILVRRPFTLAYSREQAPPEVWESPEFLRTNYLIAWAWAVAFLIQAASGFYGDAVLDNSNNLWTGWIIQTFPMIAATQFTLWYPARLEAEREGAETAPTVRDFLATLTPWITVMGILVLSLDGGPEWLGIALIVVGALGTKALAGRHAREVDSAAS